LTTGPTEPVPPTSRFSSRVEPFWLNPATIKGTVSIGVGMTILLAPQASSFVIRVVFGIALVVSGAADLWFKARGKDEGRARGVLEASASIIAGLLILLFPSATIRAVAVIAAVYFLIRGVLVIGASIRQRARSEHWIIDFSRGMFMIALGAIMLILPEAVIEGLLVAVAAALIIVGAIMLGYGIRAHTDDEMADIDAATVSQLVITWINSRDIGDERREEIGDRLFFEPPDRTSKITSWWIMLMLSVAIATFAIMQDSTAVVIGAMLIAPLMVPILGMAAAIVNAWRGRLVKSLALVSAGVGAAILLAFAIGQWIPVIVPLDVNSQVVSRVSPNMLDMLIALAAGAAGAYANVDKRVSDSIAGVAIAVALVPPLGVVGLTLEAGMFDDAFGAFLLFLTNFVSIILAATLVFFLTGFAPFQRLRENSSEVRAVLRTVAIAALVILVPLVFTAEGVLATAGRRQIAQDEIGDWLGEDSTYTAAVIKVEGARVEVLLTGSGPLPEAADLEAELNEEFDEPVTLRVEYVPSIVVEYSAEGGETRVGSTSDPGG